LLRAAGYILGLLFVNHCRKAAFDDEEMESLEFFANQAAIAILPDHLLRSSVTAMGSTAHGIRGPLTYVKRTLESAVRGAYGAMHPRVKMELEQAILRNDKVLRGIHAINSLLTLEDVQIRPEPLVVGQFVEQVGEDVKRLFLDSEVEISMSTQFDKACLINTDRVLLESIFFLLLDNAHKYTKAGHIDITVYVICDRLVFRVSDTGMGVPPQDRSRIFERLTRGSNVGLSDGSGIGLYLARHWARCLGGDVLLVESSPSGSVFEISVGAKGKQ
jgi:signal transduction histidine kinase